jgi:NTP pyrophosphatase (non-canonical NTP hydrolase)
MFTIKCKEIAEYWGDKMPMMAMEEAGELIQAISKVERETKNPSLALNNLIDEIGDMYIVLEALTQRYAIDPEAICERIGCKLNKKY